MENLLPLAFPSPSFIFYFSFCGSREKSSIFIIPSTIALRHTLGKYSKHHQLKQGWKSFQQGFSFFPRQFFLSHRETPSKKKENPNLKIFQSKILIHFRPQFCPRSMNRGSTFSQPFASTNSPSISFVVMLWRRDFAHWLPKRRMENQLKSFSLHQLVWLLD